MAENEYDSLLKELVSFIHEKRKVDVSELLEWASKKNIGTLVLTLLVKDALEEGDIKGSGGEVILDNDLGLSVPQSLLSVIEGERQEEVKTESPTRGVLPLEQAHGETLFKKSRKQVQRKRRRRIGRHTSIMTFLTEHVTEERRPEAEIHEAEIPAETASETTANETAMQKEIGKEAMDLKMESEEGYAHLEDEDILKAVEYLSMYWSVGEIRFLEDLKQQGVKNPGDVLKRLIELGYVERSRLGVINATSKLPRVKPKSYLSDLL